MQTNDLGRAVDLTAPYAPYQPDDVDFTAEMTIMENGPEIKPAIISCSARNAAQPSKPRSRDGRKVGSEVRRKCDKRPD